MAATPRPLPTPDEVLAREAAQKTVAIRTAVAATILTALAAIVDQLAAGDGIPKADKAADLVETLNAKATGTDFPASFWTAYAQFRVDHGWETILANGLRGLSLILLVPMMLLLLRGARERGGTLGKWLEPLSVVALLGLGIAAFVHEVLEVSAFRGTGPAYVPQEVFDAVGSSTMLTVSSLRGILSLVIALPIALVSMQAMRVGLLPRVLGFMGVLVGLLFVLPYDTTGLLRAIWFAAVAWAVAGRLSGGLAPACPQLRPVGISQQLAPRRGEQDHRRTSQPLPRGDVGQLELDGSDLGEVRGELLGDHRVQVHGAGGTALGRREVEAAVVLRRVPQLLNDVEFATVVVRAARTVFHAQDLTEAKSFLRSQPDGRPEATRNHINQLEHLVVGGDPLGHPR